MDLRSVIRNIIVALVGLALVVLIIVLIVKAISGLTGGGSSSTSTVNLGKYTNTDASATLLIDGVTNNDQDHRQLKLTVSGTQVEADVIQGYQGTVIDSRTYTNNAAAFGAFLQSLKLMDFSKGNTSAADADYRGYCPAGERYVYSFNNGTKDLFNFWSTSCGQGTFGGDRTGVRALFERQILQSDLGKLTDEVQIGY